MSPKFPVGTVKSTVREGAPSATLAHCVHATPEERRLLAREGTNVTHCPSSNLKLGSGIAPIPEMLAEGIHVALGADGAPCNNNLDAFVELRLAALLHKPRVGPAGMTALQALELATLGGARALGLEAELGSIEPGKRADLIVIDPGAPHVAPSPDPVSTVVYAAQSRDVRHVLVDGRLLDRPGDFLLLDALIHQHDGLAHAVEFYAAALRGHADARTQTQLIVLTRLLRAVAALWIIDARLEQVSPTPHARS